MWDCLIAPFPEGSCCALSLSSLLWALKAYTVLDFFVHFDHVPFVFRIRCILCVHYEHMAQQVCLTYCRIILITVDSFHIVFVHGFLIVVRLCPIVELSPGELLYQYLAQM